MVITRALACTRTLRTPSQLALERARRRFGGIEGAVIAVSSSPASGGRPVISLRNSLGSSSGYRVHTHFHGDQLFDGQVGYEDHIGPTVAAAWRHDPDQVFVLPEAANESAAPRSDWNNIRNLPGLNRAALTALSLEPEQAGPFTLSGHSAGGSPVARALARGEAPDRLELYDAAVSSQHNPVSDSERRAVQAWCRRHADRIVLVPGIMRSSWLDYVDRSRWTSRADNHWSPLWDSLGQERQPGS